MRLRRLAVLGVALLPVIGLSTAANAGDGHGHGSNKVKVVFTPTGPGSTLVDAFCEPTASPMCLYLVKYPAVTQVGGLEGLTLEGDAAAVGVDGQVLNAYAGTFNGLVKGCGSGTFLYGGVAFFDATGAGDVEYKIAAGSGTGDLEGITGTFTPNPDGTIGGTVRCRR